MISKGPMILGEDIYIYISINLVKLARDLTRVFTPKWWFSKGNGTPYFREIDRLVKYYEPFGQIIVEQIVLFITREFQ